MAPGEVTYDEPLLLVGSLYRFLNGDVDPRSRIVRQDRGIVRSVSGFVSVRSVFFDRCLNLVLKFEKASARPAQHHVKS